MCAPVRQAGPRIAGRSLQNASSPPAFHGIGLGPPPVCFVCPDVHVEHEHQEPGSHKDCGPTFPLVAVLSFPESWNSSLFRVKSLFCSLCVLAYKLLHMRETDRHRQTHRCNCHLPAGGAPACAFTTLLVSGNSLSPILSCPPATCLFFDHAVPCSAPNITVGILLSPASGGFVWRMKPCLGGTWASAGSVSASFIPQPRNRKCPKNEIKSEEITTNTKEQKHK